MASGDLCCGYHVLVRFTSTYKVGERLESVLMQCYIIKFVQLFMEGQ